MLIGIIAGAVVLVVVLAVVGIKMFGGHSGGGTVEAKQDTPAAPVPVKPSAPTPSQPAPKPKPAVVPPGVCEVIWFENFEKGLNDWQTTDNSATELTQGSARTISGKNSAKVTSTLNRMFRDINPELKGAAKVTFWMYDDSLNRVYGEVRAFSGGGYGKGALQQIISAGRYAIDFGVGTGDLKSEVLDSTKYQGRIMGGDNAGWFNLNAPGAPARSSGWHKFEIERLGEGGAINFYVDGILSRTIEGAKPARWNTVVIGSLGMGSSKGDAWFDDVKVESLGK